MGRYSRFGKQKTSFALAGNRSTFLRHLARILVLYRLSYPWSCNAISVTKNGFCLQQMSIKAKETGLHKTVRKAVRHPSTLEYTFPLLILLPVQLNWRQRDYCYIKLIRKKFIIHWRERGGGLSLSF